MKKHLSTIALILVLLAGVSLLLYPTVSDYWNARHASKAVADYTQNVQRWTRTPMTSCWRRRRIITGRC